MESLNDPVFREYLVEALGERNASAALEGLSSPPSVSVRLNPFKKIPARHFGEDTEVVPWNQYGRLLHERPAFTSDPLYHAGAYYVQDSSAMFPGYVFRCLLAYFQKLGRPMRVLDLCASPGGKTTDLASSSREVFGDRFFLVANEVVRSRVSPLSENVGRWGDPCVTVTSSDPKAFSRLKGFFDIVLTDVPCSGEGMFRKDPEALRQWSEDNVALCESRQRKIISDVWPALSEGGFLIYSTCTFNRRENDGKAEWIAGNLGAEVFPLEENFAGVIKTEAGGFALVPGLIKGEGQYCVCLRKTSSSGHTALPKVKRSASAMSGLFSSDVEILRNDSMYVAVPSEILPEVSLLSSFRPVVTGTAVGEMRGGDFVPHGDLALSQKLRPDAFPRVEVSSETALSYLRKDTIRLENAPQGLVLVCHEGLPLGFVRNLGTRCNNLLPKGRRILKKCK